MGRDLSAHFPLDPRRPVSGQVPGYNKNMNVDLARLTTLPDLAASQVDGCLPALRRAAGRFTHGGVGGVSARRLSIAGPPTKLPALDVGLDTMSGNRLELVSRRGA
jgi:hypothetical protein